VDCSCQDQDVKHYFTPVNSVNGPSGFHEVGRFLEFFMAQRLLVCEGLLLIEASPPLSEAPHSVGLLMTSDQPDVRTSIWQDAIHTRDSHPCPQRDSNPQSQQASGH
jgi:hypothetical protein